MDLKKFLSSEEENSPPPSVQMVAGKQFFFFVIENNLELITSVGLVHERDGGDVTRKVVDNSHDVIHVVLGRRVDRAN